MFYHEIPNASLEWLWNWYSDTLESSKSLLYKRKLTQWTLWNTELLRLEKRLSVFQVMSPPLWQVLSPHSVIYIFSPIWLYMVDLTLLLFYKLSWVLSQHSHENVIVKLGSCLSFTAFLISCIFFLILFTLANK